MQTAQRPAATRLPVEPLRPFPADALDAAVQRRAGNLSRYQMSSSDFDITFLTPVMVSGSMQRDTRTQATHAGQAGLRHGLRRLVGLLRGRAAGPRGSRHAEAGGELLDDGRPRRGVYAGRRLAADQAFQARVFAAARLLRRCRGDPHPPVHPRAARVGDRRHSRRASTSSIPRRSGRTASPSSSCCSRRRSRRSRTPGRSIRSMIERIWQDFAPYRDGGTNPGAHPGFDGIWNSATATPLERPRQLKDKAFFTPEEAAEWERQIAESNQEPSPQAAVEEHRHRHLQHVLPRVRLPHRQDAPHVHRHRPCRRPHSRAHARGGRRQAPPRRRDEERRERRGHGTSGSVSGVRHRRAADAAVFLQQQLPDRADQGCLRRARGDDPRRQNHSPGRPSASSARDQAVAGRFGRSLGRRHARRGHDELQRRRRLLRGRGRQLRVGPESSPRRALQPARRRHAALPVRDRRPHGLHATVEG